MTQPSSPTVWRRWMTFEMRRLRQEAGLSQAQVAKVLDCHVPKVSLIESGQRNIQEDDLHKLLELYDVPEERRPHYVDAARNGRKKGWWERSYKQPLMSQYLELFVGLEQGAERLRAYHPAIFYGLLQTRDYAAAILRRTPIGVSEEKVPRLVDLRMQRQAALWRDTNALRLWTVLDEAALRRLVGSREVMQAQLEHVAEIASQHGHITVQVVPFETGAYEATYGPFMILSFPWPADPGVAYIEHQSGAVYLDSLPAIDTYSQVFEHLCALALSPDESIDLIRNVAEEYA